MRLTLRLKSSSHLLMHKVGGLGRQGGLLTEDTEHCPMASLSALPSPCLHTAHGYLLMPCRWGEVNHPGCDPYGYPWSR